MSSNNKYRPNGKRKPPWSVRNKGGKRFNYGREGNFSNMQWMNHEYQAPYNINNSYKRDHVQNRTSRGYDIPNNLPGLFDYPHTYQNQPSQEQDPESAESSVLENERREKILATKRRIEEALASTTPSSQEINLTDSQETAEISKDKSSERNACIKEGAGLRLTNSDFKEIGSVESGVVVEPDSAEMILNISPHVAQQRSFDNIGVSAQIVPPAAKTRVEGWTMSTPNQVVPQTTKRQQESPQASTSSSKQWLAGSGWNMTSLNNSDPETLSLPARRAAGDLFLQESREEILGRIDPAPTKENVTRPPPKPSQPKRDFTNVGNLYQSFLRTRLFGYTYRQRNKTAKPSGPNPLLDKSVLEHQHSGVTSDQQNTILELQMPRPILVKTELAEAVNTECIEQEASEFCKEYSYLLTDPNLLIPSENLEKLGLGHLSEMNDLVNKRSDEILTNSASNQANVFRVRPLNSNLSQECMMEQSAVSSVTNINSSTSSSISFNFQPNEGRESVPSDTSKSNGQINNPASSCEQGVSVNSIADKVVEKLFSTLNKSTNNQQLNAQTLLQRTSENSTTSDLRTSSESLTPGFGTNQPPPNLVQTISGFILKIFLLDKQIEELSQEKMKIYSELLSIKDISSSLFNSWAQEQISKGNVVNCQTNESNIMPQLMRLNKITNHNDFLQALVSQSFEKKEYPEPSPNTEDPVPSSSVDPTNPSCSTPPNPKPPDIIRPKLSVRKDLHDHSVYSSDQEQGTDPLNIAANTFPVSTQQLDQLKTEIPKPCFVKVEGVPAYYTGFENADINMPINAVNKQENGGVGPPKKKNKKKKAKKKKDQVEVVELLDSTDEGSESVVSYEGNDPLETEELIPNKQLTPVKRVNKQFCRSVKHTPTCMRLFKKNTVLVGSKDGYLMVFRTSDGRELFDKKIHNDSITCLAVHNGVFVITGSLDSTVSVLSAKKQETILSFEVKAPLQCCWVRFKMIFFGTKNGLLGVYDLMPNRKGLIIMEAQPMLKLTNSSIMALATGVVKNSPQNEIIVASRGETVTIRDYTTGDILHELDWCDTVTSLLVHCDIVYCGTNTRSIKALNLITRKSAPDCVVGRCVVSMAQVHFFLIFAACKDGNIYAYNLQEGTLIATIPTSNENSQIIQSIAIMDNLILVICSNSIKSIAMPAELVNHIKERPDCSSSTT